MPGSAQGLGERAFPDTVTKTPGKARFISTSYLNLAAGGGQTAARPGGFASCAKGGFTCGEGGRQSRFT